MPIPAHNGAPWPRPTAADLAAAKDTEIPDVIAPGLAVLFSGINPGLYSGYTGRHFSRPGNRFWPALHASGFTGRLLRPWEQDELLALGLGITNVVTCATSGADELTTGEIRAGGRLLAAKVARYRPAWLAIVGISVYRTAFGRPHARAGRQPEPLAGTPVWVLPNPSGLNAHWPLPRLIEAFAEFRLAALGAGWSPTAAAARPAAVSPRSSPRSAPPS